MRNLANTAIRVENITKSYGDVHALQGVSMYAEQGKIFGLLGPNGAGKTTLVRILTTLLSPDSGLAEVAGVNVVENKARVRDLIGLAGQYPAVDEYLTGRENLIMVGQLYHFSRKVAKQRAEELLKRFSLETAANRPVKTYSGGMRRRLDLAASIVARPPILFLDEPTTGLDPRTRLEMWNVIRELVADGTTLLLTTQYLEEADELADFISVIDNGKVIAEGTSDQLKSLLGRDVLEVTLANVRDLQRTADALQEMSDEAPSLHPTDLMVTVPVDHAGQSLVEAVRKLDAHTISIANIHLRRPTLDDVFLSITSQSTEA